MPEVEHPAGEHGPLVAETVPLTPPSIPPIPPPPEENYSGLGKRSEVPREIRRRWSWGGFLFPIIWGPVNHVYLRTLVAAAVTAGVLFLDVDWDRLITLPIAVVFGLRGSEWAWRARRWRDVDHFKSVQRRVAWGALAGVVVTGVALVALESWEREQVLPGHATSDARPGEFNGHGVSFEYPSSWGRRSGEEGLVAPFATDEVPFLWIEYFISDESGVVVLVAAIDVGVDVGSDEEFYAGQDDLVRFIEAQGGDVSSIRRTRLGTLPAFDLVVTIEEPAVGPVPSRWVFGADGATIYLVVCSPMEGQVELETACDLVVDTFRVG